MKLCHIFKPIAKLLNDENVNDINNTGNDRWCEYITYRRVKRLLMLELIMDTELQVGNFQVLNNNDNNYDNDLTIIITENKKRKIVHCPAGHSSNDTFSNNNKNFIDIFFGFCELCTTKHSIQEQIDKDIQEFQKNNGYYEDKLKWISYDNFRDIKHIGDGGYGSVYSTELKNGIKWRWNFNKQDWEYYYVGYKVALKEINDSRHDVSKFLKEVKNLMIANELTNITKCIGISKNLSSKNYIIVMELYDDSLRKFITKSFLNLRWSSKSFLNLRWRSKSFLNLRWSSKIKLLDDIVFGLSRLHAKKLVHCDLHSGNILISHDTDLYSSASIASITDLGLCILENDLILKSDNKSNNIYGSIPYIPPEVLRGNVFTQKGDIYSFGGIMYEMATRNQPFYDRAHDTHLIIDICNGIRPKIPDIMLDWIPQCYSDLMYKCWNDDPSERPTANELRDVFWILRDKFLNEIEDYILQQFKIADKNRKKAIKSREHESSLSSSISHPQSCYISRSIHTLHGLYNSLEDIKSGKSQGMGDIYSFGGIMYEMATRNQPFYDRAHDTHLIIDICNGIRPKIPDIMLDWIPQCYSDLMYKCWNDDPSERPTANELRDVFWILRDKFLNEIEDYILQQFKIADKNRKKAIKSREHESSLSSSISHPQSCYISRSIHTLHGLYNSLEDIKSGKSQDPNLLKTNESTSSSISTYDIDSKESKECIDWEKEIQNQTKKRSFYTLDCDSEESKECINLDKEDNIILKKIKKRQLDYLKN
ncbi:hypothetical protein Glove_54g16 [Diversispora epigaea]|uniref:Protein kinase domain-containing protein n=1 Tax=Diversispora epigaea TaxID=1348612 RepID=A0A397JH17_9GLOM|nr:hypothetical protein Glove_54g16 [Diversispora epigaea]